LKTRSFYFQLIQLLGFFPYRLSYYRLAFVPRAAAVRDQTGSLINNERLEYLGDAILDAIVAEYLFTRFPDSDEGFMTKLRSQIVKRKNLDQIASRMDIPLFLKAGILPGNQAKHLYGNILEALIGAIYLDRGYQTARRFFIRKIMEKHIDLLQLVTKDPDYKSRVIEWAQKSHIEVIFATKEEHSGTGRSPFFISNIILKGEVMGTGRGSSKKEAEQLAAQEAIKSIQTV
jgi:ribonuclease III